MIDSENICLACGLCCDGTLIGHVQLKQEEVPALSELMDLEGDKENGFFLHPCQKYCEGCTIYQDRPVQCASFKCGLLKSVEQRKTDYTSALRSIEELKQKRKGLEQSLTESGIILKSNSFYFKMVELEKHLRKEPIHSTVITKTLKSQLKALNLFVGKSFGVFFY
jgi:hypothetical protein